MLKILQDNEKEENKSLEQVSMEEILKLQRDEQLSKKQEEDKKRKALLERGLHPHADAIQEDFF